jgi:hypothetical protein
VPKEKLFSKKTAIGSEHPFGKFRNVEINHINSQ